MTFSKVVSGMGGAPSGLLKSGTNIASKSGKDWVSYGGRRAALDPALTFWAQLNRDTQDVLGAADTFTRASDGLYLAYNGADWRIAGTNAPRHEDAKLLMEPALTNKCTNYNANPDVALTNMSVIGDAAGVLTRVYDPELIEESGLSNVCTSGYVFQLDNTAGSAVSYALVQGDAGTLAAHSASAFGVATVGNCYVRIGGVADSPAFPVGGAMQLRIISGTTVNIANKLSIGCDAGGVCRFVLNHYEELPVASSPVVTLGAAGQRAIDVLNWSGSDGFFSQSQGMSLLTYSPGVSISDIDSSASSMLLSLSASSNNLMRLVASPSASDFRSRDSGANEASVAVPSGIKKGSIYKVAVRYVGSVLQIGFSEDGGSWVWSTEVLYSGTFDAFGNSLRLAETTLRWPSRFSDIYLYDEDRGRSWIEANY